MGTTSKDARCKTCDEFLTECSGHFGHLRLTLPVFHQGYFKAIIACLACICKSCSRLLLSPEERSAAIAYFRKVQEAFASSLHSKRRRARKLVFHCASWKCSKAGKSVSKMKCEGCRTRVIATNPIPGCVAVRFPGNKKSFDCHITSVRRLRPPKRPMRRCLRAHAPRGRSTSLSRPHLQATAAAAALERGHGRTSPDCLLVNARR